MDFFAFDDEYVRRLREGDPKTVEHYFKYFNFFLGRKLQGRVPFSDADDIRQEVHARVFTYLGSGKSIRDSGKFGAFVFRFAEIILLERLRVNRRTDELDPKLVAKLVADYDIPRDLIAAEIKARVHTVLDSMDEHHAAILRAVFIDELDRDAICRQFSVDRKYLRVLIHRAVEKFRDQYDDS
jgi:RNA polymerase sigma-70 factor, ECF subfamily